MLHPCCMQRPSKIAAAHTEQPAGSWCLSWLAPEGGFGVGEAVDQDTNGLALLRLVFTVPHFRSRVLLRGGGVQFDFHGRKAGQSDPAHGGAFFAGASSGIAVAGDQDQVGGVRPRRCVM